MGLLTSHHILFSGARLSAHSLCKSQWGGAGAGRALTAAQSIGQNCCTGQAQCRPPAGGAASSRAVCWGHREVCGCCPSFAPAIRLGFALLSGSAPLERLLLQKGCAGLWAGGLSGAQGESVRHRKEQQKAGGCSAGVNNCGAFLPVRDPGASSALFLSLPQH